MRSFWHAPKRGVAATDSIWTSRLCVFRLAAQDDSKSHWLQETDKKAFDVLLKLEPLQSALSLFGHFNYKATCWS